MTDQLHATCVAWEDRGVLIKGAAGKGKSSLGLQLMAHGCALVADDRVVLQRRDNMVLAQCPQPIAGLIEARHVGLLTAVHLPEAQLVLMVDLDQIETQRLPVRRQVTLLGCDIALIHANDSPHFAAAILQILKAGWSDR